MSYILIIPGEAPVKKNARKEAWTRRDARGNRVPLSHPISYYTKEYNEWAWKAIQYLRHWKEKHTEFGGVGNLNHSIVITCWFFRSTPYNITGERGRGKGQTIDLQNLYDSILDCLAGNSGLKIPKKLQMEHEDYKIISDDSFAFIKSHGASHIFFDPTNPRTEVYISEFNLKMITEAFNLFHPDTQPLSPEESHKELTEFTYIEKETRKNPDDITLDFNLENFLRE